MLDNNAIEKLISRARGGDRAAFEELAQVFRPRLLTLVHLRLGSDLRAKIEVDDVVQETLLKAYSSLPTLRSAKPGSFFGWLAGIARHVILNQAKRRTPTTAALLRLCW